MRIVSNAEELGKVIKDNDYPISVKNEGLVSCINSLRSLSRFVWMPVVGSLGAVLVVFWGGAGVTMLITGMAGAATVGLVAAAGGGLAIAAVGIDVTLSAVKIAAGGGSIKILGEIRSREWNCSTKLEGILS